MGTAPIFALSFAGFDMGKKIFGALKTDKDEPLGVLGLAAAGGFSGVLTTTIMAPGERIKCILQVRTYLFHFIVFTNTGCVLFDLYNIYVRGTFE